MSENKTDWIEMAIKLAQQHPWLTVFAIIGVIIIVIVIAVYVEEIDIKNKKIIFKKKRPKITDPAKDEPKSLTLEELPDTITSQDIQQSLQQAQSHCDLLQFDQAEKVLAELREQNPLDFEIFKQSFYLYNNPQCQLKTHDEILSLLTTEEKTFGDRPGYYFLRAVIFMEMRDHMRMRSDQKLPTIPVKDLAIQSIDEAILRDFNNARWHRVKGYIHYWFEDIKNAIDITEKALKLAEENADKTTIIIAKNNLAYFYAKARKKEDVARDYAKELYNHDSNSANYLDSYGYVKWKFAENVEELEDAVKLFKRAHDIAPLDSDISGHLTDCRLDLQEAKRGRFGKLDSSDAQEES